MMQPYISDALDNIAVLQHYEDAMHPAIARRFADLLEREDSAEALTETISKIDDEVRSIDSYMDDLRDLATECEDEGMEARTVKGRKELRRDWCARMYRVLTKIQAAIDAAEKLTNG